MRTWLRNRLFDFVRRIFTSDDGRDILTESLREQLARPLSLPNPQLLAESPYPDLAIGSVSENDGEGTVFITGRFRSGSTLLWNVFRHTPGCTAYYEPLNERRWFDPQRRGAHTDKTHRQVENYWREYDGLEKLAAEFREDWNCRNLYMDGSAWDENLKRYIQILLDEAKGRAVLQFNRVDFRLPWLRAHFPRARIVHLYRHPRDQWVSSLQGNGFPTNGRIADFAAFDYFYLLMWARDLQRTFPFLQLSEDLHPYRLFYLIWKLSYLFGRQFADWSLSFESLVHDPIGELTRLFSFLEIEEGVDDQILQVIERPVMNKWLEYADPSWFIGHEVACERAMASFFANIPTLQLATVE